MPLTTSTPKILVLGNQAVGKTTLVTRLTQDIYSPTKATVGINLVPIDIQEREVAFLEWTDRMRVPPPDIDAIASMVIISSSSDSTTANEDVAYWNNWLRTAKVDQSHQKFLVLAQVDIRSSVIDLRELAQRYRFNAVFETSSKLGTGISQLRDHIRNDISWPKEEEEDVDPTTEAVISAIREFTEKLCVLIAKDPKALMQIHWRQLEEVVAMALESIGFSVELTPLAKDGGKDVIARCRVSNKDHIFYIEVKHWREGGRPGERHIAHFVQVNLEDATDGGLFLSTSDFPQSVYSRLAEITRQRVRLGRSEKITSLCQYLYVSASRFGCLRRLFPTYSLKKLWNHNALLRFDLFV